MQDRFISERNLRFLLYDVFDVERLTRYPRYEEHGKETFDLVLNTALKMGRDILFPCFQEMDKVPPEFVDGQVKVNPMVREFMKACGEGGWIGANAPFELGGQQLPIVITAACKFIFSAANYSATVYPFLTAGAAHLIESFGSKELRETFLPPMFAGQWQGTMALTEPQAGSSLADLTTRAEPLSGNTYQIRGQKIFISAGDHDCVDNVVHLMLAKIDGAPPGVKGISLFVVPKKRMGADGELVSNDVNVAGIYHKLGYRGAPITQLSMGENNDCRGFLVGEPHKGLSYMFQMMNEARIDVGMGAAAIASAAYHAALAYAGERPQGRRLKEKNPALPPVPIIQHPDIKRMLLFQRAIVEGSLSLVIQCGMYADLSMAAEGAEKERYSLLLDLLTGVAKSYPSEMGILSVSQGLQILGGYGYCDEFPLEQYYRDMRIHPIHEGTTGIQGLDLLGRKVLMKEGRAFALYLETVRNTLAQAEAVPALQPHTADLEAALRTLETVTDHLKGLAVQGDPERFLADATLYLELFGIIAVAWQWLVQGIRFETLAETSTGEAEQRFCTGKRYALRFFFAYELPKIQGLAQRLLNSDGLTVEMQPEWFFD